MTTQEPESFSPEQGETLIERMERDELDGDDKKRIEKIIRSYLFLASMIQQTGATLSNLRAFLSGRLSKKKKKTTDGKNTEADAAHTESFTRPLDQPPSDDQRKQRKPRHRPPHGHGRLKSSDYTGAEHRCCPHPDHQAGDPCPLCRRGTLYTDTPKEQVQLQGQALVTATIWSVVVLRCSACKALFNARTPRGKYDDSVKTSIVLSRYYLGLPGHRLERFQALAGVPLPDATQWDLIQRTFDDVFPVFQQLVYLAAQADVIHHDDTRGRILSLIDENKTLAKGARYGIHSTGLVAVGEQTIILYFTGRAHAGENLDKLLDHRDDDRNDVIQMSDALAANTCKRHPTVSCYCSAHAVRKFMDIAETFPEPCSRILAVLSEVFRFERQTKHLSPTERLAYHQAHSDPLLTDLKAWMASLSPSVEPNSPLASTIQYMTKRWEGFTRFLQVEGAPIDNNIVERILKRLIFQRKNSFFYVNEYSAYVACVLTSIIMTAVTAGINVFEYFNTLQHHRHEVARQPERWLPWNTPLNTTPDANQPTAQPPPDCHSTEESVDLCA